MAKYCFGKLPAKQDKRTLLFENYVKPILPTPPMPYNSLDRVSKALGVPNVLDLYPMDGNDTVGDCGLAGAAHFTTNVRGLIGQKFVPTKDQVLAEYYKITGGQDTGVVLLDVLKLWKNEGLFGEKIGAFVKIDHKNFLSVQQATWLFGGVYTGFLTTASTVADFQSGKVWTVGRPDGEGHCIVTAAHRSDGIGNFTWGGFQWGNLKWLRKMVDEMYAILSQEAMDARFSPGFDYATLQKDIAALAA